MTIHTITEADHRPVEALRKACADVEGCPAVSPLGPVFGMMLEDIINQLGPHVAPQQANPTGEALVEVTKVYHEMYAGSLSTFFETNWFYFTDNGKMTFPRDRRGVELMMSFLKLLESANTDVAQHQDRLGKLELRVVWELARTAYYTVSPDASPAAQGVLPSWTDPLEARGRVQVVEALLDGEYLAKNPLTPPYRDNDAHRVRQFDFWYSLAELVCRRDDNHGPAATKMRQDCLARMRSLLDGRENRDVLYSIAVVREMSPRYASMDPSTAPQYINETDPRCRFLVASKFLTNEARSEGGSSNVIRRFSEIAVYAHISPGVCSQTALPA